MEVRLRQLFLLTLAFLLAWTGLAVAAESEGPSLRDFTSTQDAISADIEKLRTAVEEVLAGFSLGSADITLRHEQLGALELTASKDMTQRSYTDEERERYTQLLTGVDTLYSAYSSTMQLSTQSDDTPVEEQLAAFHSASVDIVASDALRREIVKESHALELQSFQIQAKINELQVDLQEATQFQKEKQEADSGGTPLERPYIHALAFEDARLNVALAWYQVQTLKRSYDQGVGRIARLRKRLDGIADTVIFPEETLNQRLQKIHDRLNDLSQTYGSIQKRLDTANFALAKTRAEMGSADVMPLTPLSSRYLKNRARLTYLEQLLVVVKDETDLQKEAQEIWRARYQLFHDQVDGDGIWKYRDKAQKRSDELQRQMNVVRIMESDIFQRIAALQQYLNTENPPEVQQNLLDAINWLQKVIPDVIDRYATLIPDTTFLENRLYAEAGSKLSAVHIAEKVDSFSRETIEAFLGTELWKGEGYSVTVNKLIIAVVVFLSSFFLSSLGSHWIKRRMINRFKASTTAANATQRIVFYILWLVFALISLNIVKIPLTAFAFMGGALVVGIGFGMQNIFNNLISGFIVIFSRPFKVGDIIEVSGTTGTVQDIGSRSTFIKTFDGLDVVLPNKNLLEETLVNWTRSDARKREIVSVGVSYDADPRKVQEILLEVVNSHSKVLKDPAPFVLLSDFGDNAVLFTIYYWYDQRQAVGIAVASDLRFHIAAVLQKEGIDIPFPQRVIHMAPPPAAPSAPAPQQDAGEGK